MAGSFTNLCGASVFLDIILSLLRKSSFGSPTLGPQYDELFLVESRTGSRASRERTRAMHSRSAGESSVDPGSSFVEWEQPWRNDPLTRPRGMNTAVASDLYAGSIHAKALPGNDFLHDQASQSVVRRWELWHLQIIGTRRPAVRYAEQTARHACTKQC